MLCWTLQVNKILWSLTFSSDLEINSHVLQPKTWKQCAVFALSADAWFNYQRCHSSSVSFVVVAFSLICLHFCQQTRTNRYGCNSHIFTRCRCEAQWHTQSVPPWHVHCWLPIATWMRFQTVARQSSAEFLQQRGHWLAQTVHTNQQSLAAVVLVNAAG